MKLKAMKHGGSIQQNFFKDLYEKHKAFCVRKFFIHCLCNSGRMATPVLVLMLDKKFFTLFLLFNTFSLPQSTCKKICFVASIDSAILQLEI